MPQRLRSEKSGWFSRPSHIGPSVTVAVLAAVALVVSGCSGGTTPPHQQHPAAGTGAQAAEAPVPTTEADWRGAAEVLGRPGKLKDGTVYRFSFPRSDLDVTSQNVTVKPALALGSYAAFARYPDGSSMVMGDLVVTEGELPAVTDALQRAGINQTAIHKHLLDESPPVWWSPYPRPRQPPRPRPRHPVRSGRHCHATAQQPAAAPAGAGHRRNRCRARAQRNR
nr:DUF1259 domain-containing protein [Pseudonocardia sp. C8]